MNNNEFIAEISRRMDLTSKEANQMMEDFLAELGERLEDEDTVNIQGFGTFTTKKKTERVVLNPSTKQRMLIPPKMVVNFKASPILKDKLNV